MKLNILFLSLLDFESLEERNIYTDLLSEFVSMGHNVNIISPTEKRKKKSEEKIVISENCSIVKLKIGNIQKTNLIEKGISTLRIETLFIRGIRKYLSDVKFDLILYATPPITFQKVVSFVKKRDNAKSYLLLKDIFPQNAVDLRKISKNSPAYFYFRNKEMNLYRDADFIGTMSKGNSEYLLEHNKFIEATKVEINRNSIRIDSFPEKGSMKVRKRYMIPKDSLLLLYGGNLGLPQGIPFLLEIIDKIEQSDKLFLMVVGAGTEYERINNFIKEHGIKKTKLISSLPKHEYSKLEEAADLGLILLDSRFTIPNIPSRMLGYLQAGTPVLAATDVNTDLSEIIEENDFGKWSLHGDLSEFMKNIEFLRDINIRMRLSENGMKYLENNCDVRESYEKILAHFE